ncbi:phosphatidylserine/phosphatidylglycerophosphate/cardiolipin synthase family protein [Methanospirillum sp.]|uniref:phospholipase D-like domain-containing protein n=1 Tax=Methanospirillum sp. TaxID=45200 RepID=UPI00359FFAA9
MSDALTIVTSGDKWMNSSLSFRDVITLLLNKTSKSLFITAYAINNESIIDELIKVIEKEIPQIVLYVYSGDKISIIPNISRLRKYDYEGSNFKIIEIKQSILHAKVLVVDNLYVICGSANLTNSAMTSNYEMGLMVENAQIASQITQLLIKLS